MNSQWYRGILCAVLAWGGAGPFAAAAALGAEEVARVNGAVITGAELEAAVALQRVEGGEQAADGTTALRAAALDQLIAAELLWQEARSRDLVVDAAAVEAAFVERRDRFEDEAAFLAQLQDMGFSAAAYRDRLRRSLSVQRLLEAERDAVSVSRAEVQAFYDSEQERMRRPQEVRVRHILISLPQGADAAARRAEIEALLARVRQGEDFARLAALYSEGPSKARGGDIGYFGAGKMVPAFERAAFALREPGDVSDVVETPFGFHIIRLEGRRGGDIAPFADVAIQIHDHLRQIRGSERIGQLTEALRDQAEIEVLAVD